MRETCTFTKLPLFSYICCTVEQTNSVPHGSSSPIQLKKGNYCGKVQTALCPFQLPPVQFLLNSSLQFFTFCTFCILQCRFKFQISSLSLFFALYIIVYVLFIYSSSFSSLLLSVFFFFCIFLFFCISIF
jgi:hypothetical protein